MMNKKEEIRLEVEELEERIAPSINAIPTTQVAWVTGAQSTAECGGTTSSAYLETPGNDVGRSGGCADVAGPAADGAAFDQGGVGPLLCAVTTPGDQAIHPGPL